MSTAWHINKRADLLRKALRKLKITKIGRCVRSLFLPERVSEVVSELYWYGGLSLCEKTNDFELNVHPSTC